MNIKRLGNPLIYTLFQMTAIFETLTNVRALPAGLREAADQFRAEAVIRKQHVRGLIKARNYRKRRGMAMQLGSADKVKEGWVNVDLSPAADLTLDLREPLPFPDDSFRIIYSEHVLEHFSYPRDVTHLLSECYRVLEPGGLHSFAVPDAEFALRYYAVRHNPNPDLMQLHAAVADANGSLDPSWCRTQMDHVNYFMRQNGEHRWGYDEETMRLLLESVGFVGNSTTRVRSRTRPGSAALQVYVHSLFRRARTGPLHAM